MKKLKSHLAACVMLIVLAVSATPAFSQAKLSSFRMITAEYCGDGRSITQSYNRIVIIVKNDDNDEVASAKAKIEPIGKSPKPLKSEVELKYSKETSTKDKKRFVNSDILFESDILGASYTVTVVMLNSKGAQVGKTTVRTVEPDNKGEGICDNGFDIADVVFSARRRGLGGTISQMSSAIQYAADQGQMVVQDSIDINNTFNIDIAQGSKTSEVWLYYAVLNGKGAREFIYNESKLNEKSGLWEVKNSLNANKNNKLTITDVLISVKNPCGEIVWFTTQLNRIIGFGEEGVRIRLVKRFSKDLANELSKPNTSCNVSYTLGGVNILTTNASGIYTLGFDFKFDSTGYTLDSVVMGVQLTNCSGETQNIRITVKYDSKTGTYVGSQAISQNKSCPWVLTKGELGAYNPCGKLAWWTFTYDQVKADGKGTRAVCTTSNGDPGLL